MVVHLLGFAQHLGDAGLRICSKGGLVLRPLFSRWKKRLVCRVRLVLVIKSTG